MNRKIIGLIVGIIFLILIIWVVISFFHDSLSSHDNDINEDRKEGEVMDEFVSNINIEINGVTYTASLEDNETSRELLNRLPLTITMNELNGNEKYTYFEDSFVSSPASVGRIEAGDIMLYGDDCLVIFYDTFDTNYRYTRIGKIDDVSTLKENLGFGDISVTIFK